MYEKQVRRKFILENSDSQKPQVYSMLFAHVFFGNMKIRYFLVVLYIFGYKAY